MFQGGGLKVLCLSWEGVGDKGKSLAWTVGKQSFFQAITEQSLLVFPEHIHLNIKHLQQNIQEYRDPES